jgi:hypothetical protein
MKQDNENEVHRALALQGGVALGAYEAAVSDVLYYWIKKTTTMQQITIRRKMSLML